MQNVLVDDRRIWVDLYAFLSSSHVVLVLTTPFSVQLTICGSDEHFVVQ